MTMTKQSWIHRCGGVLIFYAITTLVITEYNFMRILNPSAPALTFSTYSPLSGSQIFFATLDGVCMLGLVGLWLTQSSILGRIGVALVIIGQALTISLNMYEQYIFSNRPQYSDVQFFQSLWFGVLVAVAFFGPIVGFLISGVMTLRRRDLGRWSIVPLIRALALVLGLAISIVAIIAISRNLPTNEFLTTSITLGMISAFLNASLWALLGLGLILGKKGEGAPASEPLAEDFRISSI